VRAGAVVTDEAGRGMMLLAAVCKIIAMAKLKFSN
jgi:hypothetical protein